MGSEPYETLGLNHKSAKVCMLSYVAEPSYLPPINHEAVSLANLGFHVEVICPSYRRQSCVSDAVIQGFIKRSIFLCTRKFFHDKFGLANDTLFVAGPKYFLTYMEFLIRSFFIALRSRADLYEAHDLPTLLPAVAVALIRGKPLVYHAHELYVEMHRKVKFARAWRLLERVLISFATDIVTPEENRSQIYYREYHTRNVPLTIKNCPPYKAPITSRKLRDYLSSKEVNFKTIVLYQGLLDTSRCIEELIEASKYFNEGIVLVLIGGGWKKWKKPESITGIPKNVFFVPRVQYEELPSYTASADIGVLFYRNDCRNNYYCAPNKLYEYMMMGLPIIAPSYPGIQKIIEGENIGRCTDPENVRQIAGVINTLAGDPELVMTMKQNCLRLSKEKYNWEREAEKLLNRYRSIQALNWPGAAKGLTK
jgi:glycosyltransferase involved in cell wall biosynthesis